MKCNLVIHAVERHMVERHIFLPRPSSKYAHCHVTLPYVQCQISYMASFFSECSQPPSRMRTSMIAISKARDGKTTTQ
eukprot:scaffold229433_cov19-Prasinocladus_malaysianus.AAC.2